MLFTLRFLKKAVLPCVVALGAFSTSVANAACVYSIANSWGSGYQASITITNSTNAPVNGWSVTWQYAKNKINSSWNVSLSGNNPYTAGPVSWNGTIQPGQSVNFGFVADTNGGPVEMPNLSGAACNGANSPSSIAVSSSSKVTSSTPSSVAPIVSSSVLPVSSSSVASTPAISWLRASGTKIVDEKNKPIYLNGTNLGNWLVWEGYLMMGQYVYRTHSQFFNNLTTTFGDVNKAKEFEHQWRLNYVTEQTIIDLKTLGFNSVRVPFHYNMFWQNGNVSDAGFVYLDNLVRYCRAHNMYILLDMHAAPGYQNPGDHSDNSDSNADHPASTVKFWDGNNIYVASQVWRHIADHYKNEPVVWGYDLINEPVTQPNRAYELLPSLITMRNAIRQVDNKHIIVAEGDAWASNLNVLDWMNADTKNATGISAAWDSNLVIQTHHYIWGHTEWLPDLYDRAVLTNKLGIPLILGEYGEDDSSILRTESDWAVANIAGAFSWTFKKMTFGRSLWTVLPDARYNAVINAIDSNTVAPSTYTNAIQFIQHNIGSGTDNIVWNDYFYDATKLSCAMVGGRKPYSGQAYAVPGVIEAENFDLGCADITYSDTSAGNTGGAYRSTDVDIETNNDNGQAGYSVGWVAAGEWLEYSVNVQQTGQYQLTYRIASPESTGKIQFIVDGNPLTTTTIPSTGSWTNWQTANAAPINLVAGNHIIRIAFIGGAVNLNNFNLSFVKTTSSSASSQVLASSSKATSSATTSATIISSVAPSSVPAISSVISSSLMSSSVKSSAILSSSKVSSSVAATSIISGRSYAIISKNSGKALDVAGVSQNNGAAIQQWAYWGSSNQLWTVTQVTGNTYKIISNSSGKSLDVSGVSTTNGAAIQQWDYFDAPNQHWIITDLGNGFYSVVAESSGKSLDVTGGSINDGALIQQWDYFGSPQQQWQFVLQ